MVTKMSDNMFKWKIEPSVVVLVFIVSLYIVWYSHDCHFGDFW